MRNVMMAALVALCLNMALRAADAADPDCLALAQSVEAAAQKQDAVTLAAACDLDAFCQRMRGTSTEDQAFYNGFTSGFKKRSPLSSVFMRAAKDGQLTFLRMRTKGTEQRALFRVNGQDGINYIETLFVRVGAQKPKIVDMFIYITGEYLSDTIRVMYQSGLKQENPTVYQKLFGGAPNITDSLPKMEQMTANLNAKNYKGVLDVYNSIPKDLRTWKPLMMMRIRAAKNLSEQHWIEAIQDYERAYPTDAALNFVKIDAFLLQNKFDDALKNVEALDASVGTDPFLNIFRANIHSKAGRHEKAVEYARKTVADMPNSLDSNGCLLDCQVAAKDYPGAVKSLDGFAGKFGWDDTGLVNNPQYQPFLTSKEYKEWKANRKQ